MSNNPFQALLSIQDEDKTSKRAQKKANAPKLTPAERAKHKEELQKQRQEVQDNSTDNFNFVKYEENDNVGFITTDDKKSGKGTSSTLTKDQFLQAEDRQQLIDNKAKSSPKTGNKGQGKQGQKGQGKTGGQGGQNRQGGQGGKTGGQGGQNRGEGKTGGQGQNRGEGGQGQGRPQNRGQGGQGQNRGPKGGNKGGNKGGAGGEGGDKKGGDPAKKNYVKKDRSKGNPKNASKRPGAGGAFNWDSNENLVKKDVNAGELVEELEKVPEPEPELEEGSVEEWFPAEVNEEAGEKVIQPEVKRVGLSAYLAEKKEEEEADAKSKALLEQLTSGHRRELNTNIPSHANISKKEDIPVQDTFFFGTAPKTQKSKTTKTTENTTTQKNLVVEFRTKKHHGFNMPRERKEEDSGDNTTKRGGNNRQRDNQGQRRNQGQKGERSQNRNNNNNNNRPKNQFSKNNKEFPPLGGKVAPQKDATWAGRTDDL